MTEEQKYLLEYWIIKLDIDELEIEFWLNYKPERLIRFLSKLMKIDEVEIGRYFGVYLV